MSNINFVEEISKLFFKSAVPKIRYRECICGYIPGKRTISDNECLNNLPLLNHITYPSLKMIPDKDEVKELFYDKETGDPKLHWCLLVEIQENIDANNWLGCTSFGEKLKLEIQQDDKSNTFDWKDIKSQNTV